jgi:hypothetical protein
VDCLFSIVPRDDRDLELSGVFQCKVLALPVVFYQWPCPFGCAEPPFKPKEAVSWRGKAVLVVIKDPIRTRLFLAALHGYKDTISDLNRIG